MCAVSPQKALLSLREESIIQILERFSTRRVRTKKRFLRKLLNSQKSQPTDIQTHMHRPCFQLYDPSGTYQETLKKKEKKDRKGNSLAVQWLGFCVFTAEGAGSIPGRGTKIPQKRKKERKKPCGHPGYGCSPHPSPTPIRPCAPSIHPCHPLSHLFPFVLPHARV